MQIYSPARVKQTLSRLQRITLPRCLLAILKVIKPAPAKTRAGLTTFLVIKLDLIGDMILAVPAFRELRRSFPGCRILAVVTPQTKPLLDICPYVDKILTLELAGSRLWRPLFWAARLLRLGWELRKAKIDSAVVLRWDTDVIGCGVALISGAPIRVGFSEGVNPWKAGANRGNDSLLTRVVNLGEPGHEVVANLALVEAMGGSIIDSSLEFWLTEGDMSRGQSMLSQVVRPILGVVAIAVGASNKKRCWPSRRYGEVCKELRKSGYDVVLLGATQDEAPARAVAEESGCYVASLVGRTSLRETAAVLARCSLMIGNDSGLTHIAASVGTPCVVISCHPKLGDTRNPNSPQRFAPWGGDAVVLQPSVPTAPCTRGCVKEDAHCILGIEVGAVVAAAHRLLSAKAGPPVGPGPCSNGSAIEARPASTAAYRLCFTPSLSGTPAAAELKR